jgi:type III restriction enzyme
LWLGTAVLTARQHRYWELDGQGQPAQHIVERWRPAEFVIAVPKLCKRKRAASQQHFLFEEGVGILTERQLYDPMPIINNLRQRVDWWWKIEDRGRWGVTLETARLLQHWRHHSFNSFCPFFCQIEAV